MLNFSNERRAHYGFPVNYCLMANYEEYQVLFFIFILAVNIHLVDPAPGAITDTRPAAHRERDSSGRIPCA